MPDVLLLMSLCGIIIIGVLAFSSASLGLLARDGASVVNIVANHFIFGLGFGLLAFSIGMYTPYTFWKKLAPYLYITSLVLTALVFVPTLGFEHGGSRRWLEIGSLSLQPSEPLKMGLIFALAAYFARERNKITEWQYGLGGLIVLCATPVVLLLLEPDHGTLGVVVLTAGIMFIAAGAPLKHVGAVIMIGVLLISAAFMVHPYVRDRVATFIHPGNDPSGSSYQIQQSLLAIGSGELTGRGFGHGIQKFQYLPEPAGDSIFAVVGEEFGFIGTSAVVVLFVLFFLRGYSVAARSPDYFGALLAVGIVTYISIHFFLNIGSMLGLIPLTGIPLLFISQGGTALFVALGAVGILVNISRSARRP